MNRRDFLRTCHQSLGGIAGSLWLGTFLLQAESEVKKPVKNWLWYRPLADITPEDYPSHFEKIKQAGIDAILPEVYNSWQARYRSKHLPSESAWLEQILPAAKAAGLEVHAWMWCMPCNIKENAPVPRECFAVNGKGESTFDKPAYVDYYRFMCPNQPAVQEFIARTAGELAQIEGVDGVHLDYIRLPDVILAESLQPKYNITQDREYPGYDYCYCERCCRLFKEQTGKNARRLPDPSKDQDWRQFRYDSITRLVNTKLVPTIKKHRKTVTAAVFPNWFHVRQEWSKWQLDAVLPMLYHNFYNEGIPWIGQKTAEGVASLPPHVLYYSGLYVPALKPEELQKVLPLCREQGAQGVSLFDAGAMSEQHWQVLAQRKGR